MLKVSNEQCFVMLQYSNSFTSNRPIVDSVEACWFSQYYDSSSHEQHLTFRLGSLQPDGMNVDLSNSRSPLIPHNHVPLFDTHPQI